MSGIFDQIINYSPPLIVSGTVNYKGTWNASTNNPPLSNPPVASTKGDYYVVSTAGTQFSISFAVGDWIISSGTAWEKVDLTDAVSSVFGRTGAVVGVSTDYSAVGLTNTAIGASSPSTGAFTTVTASSTIAASGTVTGSNLSGTNTGDQTTISGNAGSATILQTARNINGVSFNGSADITVAAAAGTLTGNTLASGVTASSLTSVGTIASLVATTADINGGTIDGTTVGATAPSTGAFTTGSFSSTLFAGGVTTLRGANVPVANNSGFLIVGSSDAAAADLGGSIGFQANTTSLSNYPMGNISARLIATGAGVYRSYMAFATTNAVGSVVERMRLTDTGLAVTGALSSTGNVTLGGGADFFNGSVRISDSASSTAPAYFQSGEPGISGSNVIVSNNYYGASGGASGRRNSSVGASYLRLNVGAASTSTATLGFISASGTATDVLAVNSTGAAVTGALSATGKFNLPKQDLAALQTGAANTGTIQFYQSSGDSFKRFLDITAGDDGGGGASSQIRLLTASGNGSITERMRITGEGNVGIGTSDQFGGGVKVVGLANATTVPASNPTGGGVLYVESGALKFRGSSGTVTTIANA